MDLERQRIEQDIQILRASVQERQRRERNLQILRAPIEREQRERDLEILHASVERKATEEIIKGLIKREVASAIRDIQPQPGNRGLNPGTQDPVPMRGLDWNVSGPSMSLIERQRVAEWEEWRERDKEREKERLRQRELDRVERETERDRRERERERAHEREMFRNVYRNNNAYENGLGNSTDNSTGSNPSGLGNYATYAPYNPHHSSGGRISGGEACGEGARGYNIGRRVSVGMLSEAEAEASRQRDWERERTYEREMLRERNINDHGFGNEHGNGHGFDNGDGTGNRPPGSQTYPTHAPYNPYPNGNGYGVASSIRGPQNYAPYTTYNARRNGGGEDGFGLGLYGEGIRRHSDRRQGRAFAPGEMDGEAGVLGQREWEWEWRPMTAWELEMERQGE